MQFSNSIKEEQFKELYKSIIHQMQMTREFMAHVLVGYLIVVLSVIAALSVINQPSLWLRLLLAIILTLIAAAFWRFLGRMCKMFREYAGVVRKFDAYYEVYSKGTYVIGEPLYPKAWESFGTPEWREPLLRAAWHFSIITYMLGLMVLAFSLVFKAPGA
jgi:hypothetical protein